jgi:hypothetical protein
LYTNDAAVCDAVRDGRPSILLPLCSLAAPS